MKARTYTIDELCRLTGFPRRTIRYYVQEGIIPPPAGRGMGGFYYDSHFAILRKVRALQAAGLKLAAIRAHLAGGGPGEAAAPGPAAAGGEALARYRLAPGVDLLVDRAAEDAAPETIRAVVRVARAVLAKGEK